jgi:hypothetical protein
LEKGLSRLGCVPSKIMPCLFYRRDVVLLVYVDDCLLFSPKDSSIDAFIEDLNSAPENYSLEDQGEVCEFLGIKVQRLPDGTIHLSQPHLIQSILDDLRLQPNSKPRDTPALSTYILHKDESGTLMSPDSFHYRRVIGKLNFLEKSTRPDIAYAVHQCARFSESPRDIRQCFY